MTGTRRQYAVPREVNVPRSFKIALRDYQDVFMSELTPTMRMRDLPMLMHQVFDPSFPSRGMAVVPQGTPSG